MKKIFPLLAIVTFLLSCLAGIATGACGISREVLGTGSASDDRAFADSALTAFSRLEDDPAWIRKIEAMGNNSWLSCCEESGSPDTWNLPYGQDEVPMDYIPSMKAGFIHAGCGGPGYSTDTWLYHAGANRWVQMCPTYTKLNFIHEGDTAGRPYTNLPEPRCSEGIAYIPEKGIVLLKGGAGGNPAFDTWTWTVSTNTWTKVIPYTNPVRANCQFDNCIGYAPGFGTYEVCGNETWRYDANLNAWAKLSTQGSPSAAKNSRLIWVSRHQRLVLWAYSDSSLWSFDPAGLSWQELVPKSGATPPCHYRQGLVYDSLNDVLIMHGGKGSGAVLPYRGPWVYHFDTGNWELMSGAPGNNDQGMQMFYEPRLNVTVVRNYYKWYYYRYKKAGFSITETAYSRPSGLRLILSGNPVRGLCKVSLSNPASSAMANLEVLDMRGHRIAALAPRVGGWVWNTARTPAGLYVLKTRTGRINLISRTVVLK